MECVHEKVQGYLHKRSKKNPFLWWKRFWFILDGKMLLYFKNKENYERLGTCKGSINMSMAQSVRPSNKTRRNYQLEIVTRTKIVLLCACNEDQRTQWLAALQKAIRLPEISSPMRERLSSRLSSNLSLKRPFSKIEEETLPDELNDLNNRLSAVKLDNKNTAASNSTTNVSAIQGEDLHDDDLDSSSKNKNTDGSSDESTLTLKEVDNDAGSPVKPNANPTHFCRKRKLSLYEEIVEEVLEIAGKRLSGRESEGSQDEEYLKELSSVLQHDEDTMQGKLQRKSLAPSKPPRIPSLKNRITLVVTDSGHGSNRQYDYLEQNKETETDDKYESANESCYVTAESSEYEGDTSSFSSSNCDRNSGFLQVERSELQVSAGSTASMESLKPQTGSLCNMLDVADDKSQHEVKEKEGSSTSKYKNKLLARKGSLKLLEVSNVTTKFRKFSE